MLTSKNFIHTKQLAFSKPKFFAQLMEIIYLGVKKLLTLQKQAGADILMLFDSWAGSLHPQDYKQFVLPSLKRLVGELKQELACPIIYYPGQNPQFLEIIKEAELDVVAVDWRSSLVECKDKLQNVCVQGNFDPTYLLAEDEFIKEKVLNLLDLGEKFFPKKHIFNVGHGLLPQTPISSLSTVVETIRSYKN